MNVRTFLLSLFSCLWVVVSSFAAAPDVPPPQDPWVAPVPERGQWIVRITDPNAKNRTDEAGNPSVPGGVNRLPVEIQSMTWNTVKRDILRYTDGTAATLFYYAGFVLVEGKSSRGEPAPVLVQQLPGTDFATLRSGGWLGMDWLEKKYYVEPVYYRSRFLPEDSAPEACYFFRKPEGHLSGSENWLPELKAWVRVGDLQPVAFSLGDRTFEFQRLDPPTAGPEMTQEQAARLLDLKDQNERIDRLRERNKRLRGE
jgi:hypothetical protein